VLADLTSPPSRPVGHGRAGLGGNPSMISRARGRAHAQVVIESARAQPAGDSPNSKDPQLAKATPPLQVLVSSSLRWATLGLAFKSPAALGCINFRVL
jgi:hypothetical protein